MSFKEDNTIYVVIVDESLSIEEYDKLDKTIREIPVIDLGNFTSSKDPIDKSFLLTYIPN
jgi:hypothetical protein